MASKDLNQLKKLEALRIRASSNPELRTRMEARFRELQGVAARSSWQTDLKTEFGKAWEALLDTKERFERPGFRRSLNAIELKAALYRERPRCIECGYSGLDLFTRHGTSKFCSLDCLNSSAENKEARERTTLRNHGVRNIFSSEKFQAELPKRYEKALGVSNPSKSKIVKKKKVLTSLRNFGTDHPMKSVEGKKRWRAGMEVALGVSNPMKLASVRMKLVKTNIERRGVPCVWNDPSVVSKSKRSMRRRHGKTNFFEGGLSGEHQKNRVQSIREACRENHGVEWTTQTDKHRQSVERSDYRRCSTDTRFGELIGLQGYEPQVVRYLEAFSGVEWVAKASERKIRIPYTGLDDRTHYYFPDLIARWNGKPFVIEVKSKFTLERGLQTDLRKFLSAQKLCRKKGVTFLLAVHHKGETLIRSDFRSLIKSLGVEIPT